MAELSPEILAWMRQINTDGGDGTVVIGSDVVVPKHFTTGFLSLDCSSGGGFPGNQWTEIVGPESSGKTMIVLMSIAANQKLDPEFTTFWVAAEPYNSEYAAMLGVDNSRVVVAPAAQAMELGLEILEQATASKLYDCLVLDSYPALIPDEEDEKAMDENTMAVGAKLFNKFWRKAGKASYRRTDGLERPFYGIIINQWRDKIGGNRPGMPPLQFSPGGHGKDYAFYMRLKVTHKEFIVEKRPGLPDPVVVGKRLSVEAIKNKTTSPKQRAEMDVYVRNAPFTGFRRGDYDKGKDYVNLGIIYGIIQLNGSWLHYDGQQWQGRDAMRASVMEDLILQSKLASEVLEVTADPCRMDQVAQEAADRGETPAKRKRRKAA